jgi:exopolysaccharide biosynthesis polyprenyl glycosylphosphotransferase
MLKSQRATYSTLALLLDVATLFLAFLAAWALRDSFGNLLVWLGSKFHYDIKEIVRHPTDLPLTYRILLSQNPLVGFREHLWVFFLMTPIWIFFLNTQRGYDATARRSGRQEFATCAYSGLLGTAAFLILIFLVKFSVSRLLMLNLLVFGIGFLWVNRTIVLPLAQRRGRQPVRNLLIIGSRAAAGHFQELLQTPAYRWSRLLGFVSDEPLAGTNTGEGANVATSTTAGSYVGAPAGSISIPAVPLTHMGRLSDLETILDKQVIDEVVIVRSAHDNTAQRAWGDVLELCLQRGRTVSMVDDFVPPVGAKVEATMMGSLPTLVMHNTPQSSLNVVIKSVMDRVIAFLAILALSPILIGIAVAIKLQDRGPVLFKQKRVGLNGRLFSFYKFRSMMKDAEKYKEEHPEIFAELNTMGGPFFKSEDDPRITRLGKILRKYSLDELPQFWNVLRGDMSLVGPRPPLPKEVEQLQPWQRRKLSVKGGLTCLWQVSGRNEITDVDEWMKLDLEYIDNWSLWLDVKLIFQTVKVMVKPRGAS